MEERIVIPKDKIKVLTSCGHFPANGYFTFEKEDAEVKQVPETFDELKELCKDNDKIGIGLEFIEYDNFTIVFKREGKILGCGDDLIIAENRTPQQMWQIIKNLIGEE